MLLLQLTLILAKLSLSALVSSGKRASFWRHPAPTEEIQGFITVVQIKCSLE